MISCIVQGGLSNCLYQYAATMAHAMRNGFEYCIPLKNENPHYEGQKPYIFPGVNYCDKLPNLVKYKEPFFHYAPIPPMDNVMLAGYWQSELYFKDFKEEILSAFGFEWELKEDTISLHIRLGDYLKLQDFHPVISKEYVSEAINHYVGNGYRKFLVFSDGIDWCIENINSESFPACEFEYSEGRTEVEDLVLGSCCASQICSNSTFSCWQHILNRNPKKTAIMPRNWFGPSLDHDTKDIYPKTAIIL